MSQRQFAIGIGFRQQCAANELMALIDSALQRAHLLRTNIGWIATHQTKRHHPLLEKAAVHVGCQQVTFDSRRLAMQEGVVHPSYSVQQRLGTPSVAEAAALAALCEAGCSGRLVLTKQRSASATLAIAGA